MEEVHGFPGQSSPIDGGVIYPVTVEERSGLSPAALLATSITGFMVSQAVYVAAKLDIANLCGQDRVTVEWLAERTGTQQEALYRLLRMLAGSGIFVEYDRRRFGNSEASSLLCTESGTFRDFAIVFGDSFYSAFGHFAHSVRTGEPAFDAVLGVSYDEYYAKNPEAGSHYHAFMAGGKSVLAGQLADQEWWDGELVVDVGGGNGALLIALLQYHPGLRGIVTDLPHVVDEARERIADAGLDDRITVVGGSYFDEVPTGGRTYVLSRILHGWQDRSAELILRNIREAITDRGRLLIVNGVVAPPNEPGEKLMDLLALALGGRERTEQEWRTLLGGCGFEMTGLHPGSLHSLICAEPV